jgi:hypothetical protein
MKRLLSYLLLGVKVDKTLCGVCFDDLEGDESVQCYQCRQIYHCDCVGVEESMLEDDFQEDWYCDDCLSIT